MINNEITKNKVSDIEIQVRSDDFEIAMKASITKLFEVIFPLFFDKLTS